MSGCGGLPILPIASLSLATAKASYTTRKTAFLGLMWQILPKSFATQRNEVLAVRDTRPGSF